jgi:molecular chaperone DnaK
VRAGGAGAAGGQPGDGSKVVDAEFEDVDHNKKNQG